MPSRKHCCCVQRILCDDNTLRDCLNGKTPEALIGGFSNDRCSCCDIANTTYIFSPIVGVDAPICGYGGCVTVGDPFAGCCPETNSQPLLADASYSISALGGAVEITVTCCTYEALGGSATLTTAAIWRSTSPGDLNQLCADGSVSLPRVSYKTNSFIYDQLFCGHCFADLDITDTGITSCLHDGSACQLSLT